MYLKLTEQNIGVDVGNCSIFKFSEGHNFFDFLLIFLPHTTQFCVSHILILLYIGNKMAL